MKNFLSGKIYLILVIIQKVLNNETNKKVIGKMKELLWSLVELL